MYLVTVQIQVFFTKFYIKNVLWVVFRALDVEGVGGGGFSCSYPIYFLFLNVIFKGCRPLPVKVTLYELV